ncbi:NAD(P)/FAD-dependent oxidoreductase [Patescibacteria group bacterium]
MDTYDYLIVGGGIAGTTAAETLRSEDTDASIAIISDEPHRLYSRVMLSKPQFFLGKIPFESIWLKEEGWHKEHDISFLAGKTVESIDSDAKKIGLDDGSSVGYGKLLVACGSICRPLPVPGVDKKGVYHVKTLDDGKGIIEHVKKTKKAVVVGGGFISFEMCDMLHLAGIEVTAVIREPYFWDPQLDEESGKAVERVMEKEGITILRESELKEITGTDEVEGVVLKNGETLECQMVIVGIGSCLKVDWLKGSGVTVERGVRTNEYLETTREDIYAAGDVVEFDDLILEEKVRAGTWVNAQVQGKTAALNMAGKHVQFRMMSYYTAHGFDTSITFCGDVLPGEDRTTVRRGSHEEGSFSHFNIRDGRVIGATFMNRGSELAAALRLISNHVDVSEKLDMLADPDIDPKTLIPSES